MLVAQSSACVTSPGKLEISVSGATESPTTSDYYVVGIPLEGDPSVKVTITGSGQVSCPEECVCDHDSSKTTQPNEEGEAEYTFVHTVGEQSDGGTGNKIEWDINSSTNPGEYTFKLTEISQKYADCPDDYSGGSTSVSNNQVSDEITIVVARVEMQLEDWIACDGESIDIDLIVFPPNIEIHLSNAVLTMENYYGGSVTENPSGVGSKIVQREASQTKWKIDNARWFSTQANHCNEYSDYIINGTIDVYGVSVHMESEEFGVDSSLISDMGHCFNGSAWVVQEFSGKPKMVTAFNNDLNRWEVVINQDDFIRDVRADFDWQAPVGSQYSSMIIDEEHFHASDQMENVNHVRWGTVLIVSNIMNQAKAGEPYTSSQSAEEAQLLAKAAFQEAYIEEWERTAIFVNKIENFCADELEAKTAVGASHRVSMPCTYSWCQQ